MSALRYGLVGLFFVTASADAQSYTGTYVTPNATGANVTLVLEQDARGNVTGSLSGTGVTYAVQGLLEEGTVLGTLSSAAGGVYFAAEYDGSGLVLTLFEADANNQPDYSRSEILQFTRVDHAAAPQQQQNPLAALAPPPPPVAPRGVRPDVQTRPPAGLPTAAGRRNLDGWNISYALPSGWQVSPQNMGRITVLASMTHAGAIFVAPGLYSNFNEITMDVGRFYQAMGHVPSPVEQPAQTTIAGFQAMTATLMSQDQMGQVVHSRAISLLTPYGTGFVIIGMTTPQQMPQLQRTVGELAASVQAQPPEQNQQLVAALRGKWMYYEGRAPGVTRSMGGASRSHEEFVTFDGMGNFQWQSSSSVSVTAPGLAGTAGGANANSDRGTYTVIGNTLVIKGQQGQQAYQLQVLADRIIADGRTYLRTNQ